MSKFLIISWIIVCLAAIGGYLVNKIELEQNCVGYLKRASNSNSVERAQAEMHKAVTYLQQQNLTTGYTSVWYKTPDEDIAFWFNNLAEQDAALFLIDSTSSELERSNVLMKLRETLVDAGHNGEEDIIVPKGLKYYPNNFMWGLINIIAIGGILVFWIWIQMKD